MMPENLSDYIDIIFARTKEALLGAIEKDGTLWATEMEKKYPTWKGSRIIERGSDSIKIGFENTDAAKREAGVPAAPIIGRYVQQVKTHNRNITGGGSKRIRAHQRVYSGYRPIQLPNGQWRMMSALPAIKATKPISRSTTKRYTGKAMEKLIADAIKAEFN